MSGLPQLRFHLQMQAYSPFPHLSNIEGLFLLFSRFYATPLFGFLGNIFPKLFSNNVGPSPKYKTYFCAFPKMNERS